MTHATPYILASDDSAIFKLVFWGAIILIIGIVKVVKFFAKVIVKPPARPSDAPPAMRNAQRLPPRPAGAMALPPLSGKAAKTKRKVARRMPAAPVPINPVQGIVSALQQPRPVAAAPQVAKRPSSGVAGWLNVRTIREQFAMAEAMKPALGLTNDRFTSAVRAPSESKAPSHPPA